MESSVKVFELPRIRPGMSHDHPSPSARRPWWTWTCRMCTPELFEIFTTRDTRSFPPTFVKCAFCDNQVRYRDGLMAGHLADVGWRADCLGSGLSVDTASRLFRTVRGGHTVGWFVLESRTWRRAHPLGGRSNAPLVCAYEDLIAQFVDARKMAGLRQKDLADPLGRSVPRVSTWETGDFQPSLHDTVRWAKLLRRSLVMHTAEFAYALNSTDEISRRMEVLRKRREIPEKVLAPQLGISVAQLRDREDGRDVGKLTLFDLTAWTRALKSGLTLLKCGKE